MKKIILFFLLLPTINSFGQILNVVPAPQIDTVYINQTIKWDPATKTEKILLHATIITCGLVAGVADGQREVIQHNKWAYRYRHPEADEYWWNPDSTWKRADGRGNNTLSGSFFVFLNDKYHLNGFIRTSMFTTQYSVAIVLNIDDVVRRRKFKVKKLVGSILEINLPYMGAKYLTHRYYDVF